jgi:hypothetical protein
VVGLGLIAAIFNLVIPIHLTKAIWAVLDIGSAAVLVAYWRGVGK